MGKLQVNTGRGSQTINTNNVWDRIVALETNGVPNLSTELNGVKSQLSEKAKQSDLNTTNNSVSLKADKTYVDTLTQSLASGSPKGTYATLSALQTAFPTGNSNIYVVTADGKWYYWNGSTWTAGGTYQSTGIPDKSLTANKMTFFNQTKNLFDKATITTGFFVAYSNGTLNANASYDASDWIPVQPNTTYTRNQNHQMALYDANKVYISGINGSGTNIQANTFTTPINCAYIRITVSPVNLNVIQVELGSAATSYTPYGFGLDTNYLTGTQLNGNLLIDGTVSSTKVASDVTVYYIKNKFNKAVATSGMFVDWTNGNLVSNVSYYATDWIPVKASTAYTRTQDIHIAFYDSTKTFLNGTQTSGSKTITTPVNCAFVRCSIDTRVQSIDTYQFEEGSTETIYTPYSYGFPSSVNGIPVNVGSSSSGNVATTWNNKVWSSMGDSITAGLSWQPVVTSKLGLSNRNFGVGGTKIADTTGADTTAMCRDERINLLDSASDLITVMGGTNDWAQNVPLGNITDTITSTFYGALNVMITKIVTKFPSKRLVLMATPYGKYANRAGWTDTYGLKNNLGLTTLDYGKAVKDIARIWGIPVADIGGMAGWNDVNIATYVNYDGAYLHPNAEGGKRVAEVLIGELKKIEPIA